MNYHNEHIADFLHQPRKKLPRIIVFTVALTLIVAIGTALLVKMDTVITVSGRITPEGKVKVVQAVETGEVKEVRVKEGQQVQKDDVIALLDPMVSQAELAKLEQQSQMAELNRERVQASLDQRAPSFEHVQNDAAAKEAELWRVSEKSSAEHTMDLQRQETLRELEIASTQAEIQKSVAFLHIAQAQEEAVRDSAGTAISQFKYMEYLDNRNRLQGEVAVLNARLKKEREELIIAHEKIVAFQTSRTEELLKERENLDKNLRELTAEIIKAKRNSNLLEIRAPEAGYITELKITHPAQLIRSAEEIAKLVPSDATLVVRAKVNSNDVGFLSTGALADVKIDAFPYQTYGSIDASIAWISADAEDDKAGTNGAVTRQYSLEAKLGEWTLSEPLSHRIKPGMSVQMDIKTDRRSIASILFNPILSNVRSAIRNN